MILILTLFLLAFVLSASSTPVKNYELLPEQYKELLPPQARDFLENLSVEEQKVLREAAKNYQSYKNEEAFLEDLKTKSPSLHEKAEKLHNLIREKLASLQPESREFVEQVLDEARKLQAAVVSGQKPNLKALKKKAIEAIAKYQSLSIKSKEELHSQFPVLTVIFNNERFRKLAETSMEKQAVNT